MVYHFAPSVFGNMDIFFVINHFNLDKWMKKCVMSTKVTIQLLTPFQSIKNQTRFLFKPFDNFTHGYFEHMDLVDEIPKKVGSLFAQL